MVVGTLEEQSTLPAHIRPFNPVYDLGDLATLIEIAFGPELSITGSHMVRDMRQMALWGPMLWLAGPASSLLKGYVWIEDGRLVGNASIAAESGKIGDWTISNVAVLPEYRGRGIAGHLVDTALEHVRSRGGRRVFLQVRSDNVTALSLYEHRGFRMYDTLHELELPRHGWLVSVGRSTYPLREVRAGDQEGLYALFLASTPQEVLAQHPIRPRQLRRGLGWQLRQVRDMFIQGRRCQELVGEELGPGVRGSGQQGRIVAYGSLTTYLSRGPYELDVRVLPERRGSWEAALIEGLLTLGEGIPRQRVRSYVSTSHPEAIDAYHRLGFRTLRVLDQMVLELLPRS
jgi:ribosomal protein S18 acetylase RimI-like enzyme